MGIDQAGRKKLKFSLRPTRCSPSQKSNPYHIMAPSRIPYRPGSRLLDSTPWKGLVCKARPDNWRDVWSMQQGSDLLQLEGEEHDPVWLPWQSVHTTNILKGFVIVSKKTSGKQAIFSEDSDSGAFVLDHEGHICGRLCGGRKRCL